LFTSYLSLVERLSVDSLLLAKLLEADGLDGNEASGIHGREALKVVHGSVLLGVEVGRVAGAVKDIGVALVSSQLDLSGNVALREDDGVFDLGADQLCSFSRIGC
jgi:hypothetical protein